MRLFSDVFTIRDPHPTKPGQYIDNHFASSLGPLSILFFENPAKFDQWNECNNDTFYKKRDSFEPRNDFDANAFLDVGVALGCITGYALSLGLDPSFLGCVRPNPEFPSAPVKPKSSGIFQENSFEKLPIHCDALH